MDLLLSIISARQEFEFVIAYLLGAILLFVCTFLIAGIVLLHHARTTADVLEGRVGVVHHQAILEQINNILRTRSVYHGSLLFVSLGIVCLISVLLLLLVGVCACFTSTRIVEYLLIVLLVLTIAAVGLLRR